MLALLAAILLATLAPAVAAQEPPEPAPDADAMVIHGTAPVPPGSVIRVEALDPVAIRGVECVRGSSEADTAVPQGSSVFSLTVYSSCFKNLAANLRVCWGATDCLGFEFAPGKTVILGDLNARRAAQASQVILPDAGAGAPSSHPLGNRLAKQLAGLGTALIGAGLLSIFGYARITLRTP